MKKNRIERFAKAGILHPEVRENALGQYRGLNEIIKNLICTISYGRFVLYSPKYVRKKHSILNRVDIVY